MLSQEVTSLGMLPWNLCSKVYTYCETTSDNINCIACRGQRATPGCKVWKGNPDCDNVLQERSFNITHWTRGQQETTLCSAIVPGDYGSQVMADWYFVCGNGAYMVLPRYWGGLCALVPLISPIAFIRKGQHVLAARSKHAVMPEVKRWGGLTTDTGVPWEFKIWGRGEKFMRGMFPWVGVGEIQDHVEINRYGLLRLINSTHQLANGTVRELTELRNMVLQNRVVLDSLKASQGGVYKIIGPACCTFIPDETGTSGTISDALHDLEELKHYAESRKQGSHPFDFFSWFTSGHGGIYC
ncbi:endogenous retrovirus group PABLB member 1 Env polyprotein-like [Poecilia reticulata]|uniref:endogenous retrovirus group PABLB member 1 Env polyprotein-like n=1 Tax=Poecilia reticulata TaxID=8081 RepID=UPI0007EBBEBF|nr:PREDICTED: endogenous retrovirus group PABLB member 1 Env polyprotein-like [Poecilia reticulata]